MQAIIAIDPSLSNTAICCLARGHYNMRCVRAREVGPSWRDRHRRYSDYCRALRLFYESQFDVVAREKPEWVFIEGYSFGSKGRAVSAMYELGTELRQQAEALTFDGAVIEVSPSTIKQFATGKGNANKTAVVASITKRYGVEFKTDDEYDAFALAQLGACALGWTEPVNDAQRKAVAVVQKLLQDTKGTP